MNTHFDNIIIGAGQAGPYLAGRLTESGRQTVAFVERDMFGGTCVNTGCTPTKAMVASAYAAHLARRSSEYGVTTGDVGVDMKFVKARKDRIVADSRNGLESWIKSMEGCTVVSGHARFVSANEISVGDRTISADRIFINVGGRPSVPKIPGIESIPFLTSTTILDVDFVPGHLLVIGGSYIGLEFAQMFRRFGSDVTVIETGERLIGREDEEVSAAIKDILEAEGVRILLKVKDIAFSADGPTITAKIGRADDAPEETITATHVLLATGRRPNTNDLGLENAGVETDPRGFITVNDKLETSVPGIWALGDCNGRGAFTHTAYNDGEIVAANLLDGDDRRVSDRIMTYALFIDPPLGRAGLTEAEIRRNGNRFLIGRRPMTRVQRAVEKGETAGFIKIMVDADSKEILGASILGVGGDEVIHSLLDVMYAKAPYTTVQRAVHIHPTVSELIPTVLGDLKPA